MVLLNPRALQAAERVPSQAFPFSISETTGEGRALVLRGRSLPYRGVTWGSEERVEVKYFPGNPVAQAQVLGPTWSNTTISGKWKDVFLDRQDSRVTLLNFPAVAPPGRSGSNAIGGKSFDSGGAVPTGDATRARTVRDAIYLLQRAGQLLRVEWGSLVRFGFIERFDPTHDREEDIGWEIEFKWIGDSVAPQTINEKPRLDVPGLLAQLISAVQEFINQINTALALLRGSVTLITQRITRLASLAGSLIESFEAIVAGGLIPLEVLGTIKEQLTSIVLAARDVVDTANRVPQAYAAAKEDGNPIAVNEAATAAQVIAANARRLGVEAATTRSQIEELESPDLLAIVQGREGTSLVDVSTEYYGDPDEWTTIADFNGLASKLITRGQTIYVPRLEQGIGSP